MRILLVGFGGLLMGLSTAPFSNFYFAWIALVPLWVFLVSETTKHITHKKFKNMGIKYISSLCKKNHIIFDLKYLFSKNKVIKN